MGIPKGMFSLLCECKRDFHMGENVLELGKQDIYANSDQISRVLNRFGMPRISNIGSDKISDVDLFKLLGFKTVESMDANSYEGADHIHDLNDPIPDEMRGQYDVVYDGGTLEHVFNFPQCLSNIFDLLKPGGIVIHASPSHNHVDHGFYMFSPTIFYDYYTANGFKILKSYIFEYKKDHTGKDWLIYDYVPGSIDHLSFGGWGNNLLGIFFVARKEAGSTSGVIPQQGVYVRTWDNGQSSPVRKSSSSGLKGLVKRLLTMPGFDRFSDIAYRAYGHYYRLTRGKPPVIARY